MLVVNSKIVIPDRELVEHFIHASGPGGQHVNKVASAVQLRFDVAHSPSLPADIRARLMKLAAGRINAQGVLILESSRFRRQERNREEVRSRLVDWIRRAAQKPKRRIPTKPTRASRKRRLDAKRRQSLQKRQRRRPGMLED